MFSWTGDEVFHLSRSVVRVFITKDDEVECFTIAETSKSKISIKQRFSFTRTYMV